ncbi:10676_t:CDS:1, partial [Funneliformis geosporum]
MHIMKFKNYKAMENISFYFVKDLKADSDLMENNIINEKTVKLQKQKPNSYIYVLMQTDGKLAKEIARQTLNSIVESWE